MLFTAAAPVRGCETAAVFGASYSSAFCAVEPNQLRIHKPTLLAAAKLVRCFLGEVDVRLGVTLRHLDRFVVLNSCFAPFSGHVLGADAAVDEAVDFSRHARRKNIALDDILLLARRKPELLPLLRAAHAGQAAERLS